MLMSDANIGLSGRKRGVGAMRGLISLAVIFFVALSAQASAKTTYLQCAMESRWDGIKRFTEQKTYEVTFSVNRDGEVSFFKGVEGCENPSPSSPSYGSLREDMLLVHCFSPVTLTLEIEIMTGNFQMMLGKDEGTMMQDFIRGTCTKKKPKF